MLLDLRQLDPFDWIRLQHPVYEVSDLLAYLIRQEVPPFFDFLE